MIISKGDVVIIPFTFTDNSNKKLRPAIVVTDQMRKDIVLCQITSRPVNDDYAIPLSNIDFLQGTLRQDSWIRVNKIFTMDVQDILKVIGTIDTNKRIEIQDKLLELFCN